MPCIVVCTNDVFIESKKYISAIKWFYENYGPLFAINVSFIIIRFFNINILDKLYYLNNIYPDDTRYQ